MEIFLQQLINGLTYGSLLGFIALGYTMVYGVLKLINFAHGDIVTLASFLVITFAPLAAMYGAPAFVLVIIASIAVVCAVAALLERVAYRPLRSAPRLSLIVSALGTSMVMQNAVMLIWGPNPKIFPAEFFPTGVIHLGNVSLTYLNIIILILNIVVMLVLHFYINKTRNGIAIKALSIDYATAQLMGVNVNRTIMLVFIIGGALGAMGGMLIGANYVSVSFNMGFDYGIKAFVAAILGGIGSIPGAMMGGILLGLIFTMTSGYISTMWANAFTYIILIIMLIVRPNGLFGDAGVTKV